LKNREKLAEYDVFNIGYGEAFSIDEIIDIVNKVTSEDLKVEYTPPSKGF
jgi:UDP-glucose 4-epimerase